jgi:tetratricopeptide (TPR) repeat protein
MKVGPIVSAIIISFLACGVASARHLDKSSSPEDLRAAADYLNSIKSPTAEQYYTKGKIYCWLKDWKAGSDAMTRAIKLKPTANAYGLRALCYRAMGKFAEALQDCNKATALGDKSSDLVSLRGAARLGLKDYIGALRDASTAINMNSQDANAYYVKGAAEFWLDRPNESILSLSKSIELDSSDRSTFLTRSQVYKHLGNTAASKADLAIAESMK